MQKRGIFRLLAASAAIILIVSVCCITVLGYDMDPTPKTYAGTVTRDDEQTPVEPTEDPDPETPTSTPTSTTESTTTPSSNENTDGNQGNNTTDSQGGTTGGQGNTTDSQSGTTGGQGNTTGSQGGTTGGQGNTTNSQGETTGGQGNTTGSQGSSSQGTYNPDTTTNSSSTTTVISGPDFSDEDNSELVNDGSVISGLPIGGESESAASTEESSSQLESTAFSSGNSGSTFLLVLGIVLIVVGVAGLGAVVYLQFIRPKQKPKKTDSLYDGDFDVYHDGYDMSSSPLQKDVDTKADTAEIDIHSHSSDDKK